MAIFVNSKKCQRECPTSCSEVMRKLLANDSPTSCTINTSSKLCPGYRDLNLLASKLPLYMNDTVKSSYALGVIVR